MDIVDKTFKQKGWKKTSPFGFRKHPKTGKISFHTGMDFGTNLEYWSIYAIGNGEVIASNSDETNGNYIWVKYPKEGIKIFVCHLLTREVSKGDFVNSETCLGQVGESGRATGIHLHMGVKKISTNLYFDYSSFVLKETSLADIEHSTIKKGDFVKVIGINWSTGSKIPSWVKLGKYQVDKINEKTALLKGINSWAYIKDLKKV